MSHSNANHPHDTSEQGEGVIKFKLEHENIDIINLNSLFDLNRWREKLFKLKLIGQDPLRYGGYAYGNLSRRLENGSNEFIISGSQTSHLPELAASHYAWVVEADIQRNYLKSRGLVKPSSEALTHSVFYQSDPAIKFVFHVHSPEIWNDARVLNIPVTDAAVAYGTPAMAEEIKKLFTSSQMQTGRIVAMGGHRDGIISFGQNADQAGDALLVVLRKSR